MPKKTNITTTTSTNATPQTLPSSSAKPKFAIGSFVMLNNKKSWPARAPTDTIWTVYSVEKDEEVYIYQLQHYKYGNSHPRLETEANLMYAILSNSFRASITFFPIKLDGISDCPSSSSSLEIFETTLSIVS